MVKDNGFPIQQGKVNLTSGSISGLVLCVADGSITVTWANNATDVINTVAGDAIDLGNAKSAVVTTGMFHSA